MPTKCIEYMACKKTFLTTPISQDVVNKNDTGIDIRSDFSEKELIDNLIILIEDYKLREKLGRNGLMKVNHKFKWEVIIKELNSDLIQVVN